MSSLFWLTAEQWLGCTPASSKATASHTLMTAGQASNYPRMALLLRNLPGAKWLLADRRYDADWIRGFLTNKGIKPCILGRKSRDTPVSMTNVATSAAKGSRSCSGA